MRNSAITKLSPLAADIEVYEAIARLDVREMSSFIGKVGQMVPELKEEQKRVVRMWLKTIIRKSEMPGDVKLKCNVVIKNLSGETSQ